jgi:Mrp family chromosome partitioning ATPase
MKPVLLPLGKIAPVEPATEEAGRATNGEAVRAETGHPAPQPKPGTELFRAQTQVVTVDPLQLERERILAPGATAQHGVPYKMLRTQVLRRLDKLGVNSLAVVGTAVDTGKTLTAINLAIAIAADPERTALLIDFDLRKPSIHRRFGVEPAAGVDDCLRGQRPLADALLRPGGYERFTILPCRERSLDSSELLSSRRTQELILEMRNRYRDRVLVFDLPPVLHADDALAFARHMQAVLVVVGEGKTRRDELLRTLELLREMPIIGTVLNGTRERVNVYY